MNTATDLTSDLGVKGTLLAIGLLVVTYWVLYWVRTRAPGREEAS